METLLFALQRERSEIMQSTQHSARHAAETHLGWPLKDHGRWGQGRTARWWDWRAQDVCRKALGVVSHSARLKCGQGCESRRLQWQGENKEGLRCPLLLPTSGASSVQPPTCRPSPHLLPFALQSSLHTALGFCTQLDPTRQPLKVWGQGNDEAGAVC